MPSTLMPEAESTLREQVALRVCHAKLRLLRILISTSVLRKVIVVDRPIEPRGSLQFRRTYYIARQQLRCPLEASRPWMPRTGRGSIARSRARQTTVRTGYLSCQPMILRATCAGLATASTPILPASLIRGRSGDGFRGAAGAAEAMDLRTPTTSVTEAWKLAAIVTATKAKQCADGHNTCSFRCGVAALTLRLRLGPSSAAHIPRHKPTARWPRRYRRDLRWSGIPTKRRPHTHRQRWPRIPKRSQEKIQGHPAKQKSVDHSFDTSYGES